MAAAPKINLAVELENKGMDRTAEKDGIERVEGTITGPLAATRDEPSLYLLGSSLDNSERVRLVSYVLWHDVVHYKTLLSKETSH